MKALVGVDLRPFHVIVSAEFDELVTETVNSVRSKMRPKVRSRTELVSFQPDPEASRNNDIEATAKNDLEAVSLPEQPLVRQHEGLELRYERTFLCLGRRLRDTDTVVQSTASHCTLNPRRYA